MAAVLAALFAVAAAAIPPVVLPYGRPALAQRTFSSPVVEQTLATLHSRLCCEAQRREPALRTLFENCLPMTLDGTVKRHTGGERPDTYLSVANVNDSGFVGMWLRDSAGQVAPYRLRGNIYTHCQDPCL